MTAVQRALYVCRRYSVVGVGTMRRCVDCGTGVAVHQPTLVARGRVVSELGADIEIVCDDCAVAYAKAGGSVLVIAPSSDEIADADAVIQEQRA